MEKSDVLLKGIVKRFFNEKVIHSSRRALVLLSLALDIEEDLRPRRRPSARQTSVPWR